MYTKTEFAERNGMIYCVVRTHYDEVHAGYLMERVDREVKLSNTRRLIVWDTFTLSELALNGVANPKNCKFSIEIPEIILTDVIEIIPCTKEAMKSIQNVR